MWPPTKYGARTPKTALGNKPSPVGPVKWIPQKAFMKQPGLNIDFANNVC